MNRRELLTTCLATGALGATVAVESASAAAEKSVRLAEQGRQQLSDGLESLEARFDKLEHHHRNLIRVGALAFGLSTGIDILTFL